MNALGLIIFLATVPLMAERPVSLRDGVVTLQNKEAAHFAVSPEGSWRRVDRIEFVARGSQGASLEVLADGEARCQVTIKNGAHQYSCEIERTSKTITFRHLDGAPIQIDRVSSFQASRNASRFDRSQTESDTETTRVPAEGSPLPDINLPAGNRAAYLTKRTLEIVRRLNRSVRDGVFAAQAELQKMSDDLDSLKVVASIALSKAKPNEDLSFTTLFAMLRLQKQIDGIDSTVRSLLKNGDTYFLTLDLLTVREVIEDRLDVYRLEKMIEKNPAAFEDLLKGNI